MNTVRYIKSFSKGQITIPKEFREFFGIGDEFWLKLQINDGKLIAEPVEKKGSEKEKAAYRKKLLAIKADWFDENDYKAIRKENEDRLKEYGI